MSSQNASVPVIVVGSINQDYIIRVSTPPGPGETILARSLAKQPGGKGGNQAVAAARLGGEVRFVGCLGDDNDGDLLLRELRAEGIDTTAVEIAKGGTTGLALVAVHDSGENSITVVPGANHSISAERVERVVAELASAAQRAVVVVQAELLTGIIEAAIRTAEAAGVRSILNLAPYRPLSPDLLALCDPLVVNEAEASSLVGWEVTDAQKAELATEQLRGLARSLVITMGAEGAFWADAHASAYVPAPAVTTVVDTTGAGDAFVGALATFLASGLSLGEAVQIAVRAGAFAVQGLGAQSSYPTLADLDIDPHRRIQVAAGR